MDPQDQPIVSSQLTLDIQSPLSFSTQQSNNIDAKNTFAEPPSFGWESNTMMDNFSNELPHTMNYAFTNAQTDFVGCADALSMSEASVCSSMDTQTPDMTPSADMYFDHSAYYAHAMTTQSPLNSPFGVDPSISQHTYFSDQNAHLASSGGQTWMNPGAAMMTADPRYFGCWAQSAETTYCVDQRASEHDFYRKQMPIRRHNTVSFPYRTESDQVIDERRQVRRQSMSRLERGVPMTVALDPFGNLTKAQLIERVVQLEMEKKMVQNTRPEMMSPSQQSFSQETSDEDEIHQCQWANCSIQTLTLEELIGHIRNDHVGSGKPAYFCEWKDCPRDRKPFLKRHKMHNHMRTHTGERPFVCTAKDCDKRFSRPDSLNTHIKTHSNVRPYVCPLQGCGKAYFHSRSLRKHSKSHGAGAICEPTQPDENMKNMENDLASLASPIQHDSFTNMPFLPYTEPPHLR